MPGQGKHGGRNVLSDSITPNPKHTYLDIIKKGRDALAEDMRSRYEQKKTQRERADRRADAERLAQTEAARDLALKSSLQLDESKAKLVEDMETNFRALLETQLTAEICEDVFSRRNQIVSTCQSQIMNETKSRLIEDLGPFVTAELTAKYAPKIAQGLRKELAPKVRKELHAEMGPSVKQQLETEFRTEMNRGIKEQFVKELRAELEPSVREQVARALSSELGASVRKQVARELHAELKLSVKEQLDTELRAAVRDELRETMFKEVRTELMFELQQGLDNSNGPADSGENVSRGTHQVASDCDAKNGNSLEQNITSTHSTKEQNPMPGIEVSGPGETEENRSLKNITPRSSTLAKSSLYYSRISEPSAVNEHGFADAFTPTSIEIENTLVSNDIARPPNEDWKQSPLHSITPVSDRPATPPFDDISSTSSKVLEHSLRDSVTSASVTASEKGQEDLLAKNDLSSHETGQEDRSITTKSLKVYKAEDISRLNHPSFPGHWEENARINSKSPKVNIAKDTSSLNAPSSPKYCEEDARAHSKLPKVKVNIGEDTSSLNHPSSPGNGQQDPRINIDSPEVSRAKDISPLNNHTPASIETQNKNAYPQVSKAEDFPLAPASSLTQKTIAYPQITTAEDVPPLDPISSETQEMSAYPQVSKAKNISPLNKLAPTSSETQKSPTYPQVGKVEDCSPLNCLAHASSETRKASVDPVLDNSGLTGDEVNAIDSRHEHSFEDNEGTTLIDIAPQLSENYSLYENLYECQTPSHEVNGPTALVPTTSLKRSFFSYGEDNTQENYPEYQTPSYEANAPKIASLKRSFSSCGEEDTKDSHPSQKKVTITEVIDLTDEPDSPPFNNHVNFNEADVEDVPSDECDTSASDEGETSESEGMEDEEYPHVQEQTVYELDPKSWMEEDEDTHYDEDMHEGHQTDDEADPTTVMEEDGDSSNNDEELLNDPMDDESNLGQQEDTDGSLDEGYFMSDVVQKEIQAYRAGPDQDDNDNMDIEGDDVTTIGGAQEPGGSRVNNRPAQVAHMYDTPSPSVVPTKGQQEDDVDSDHQEDDVDDLGLPIDKSDNSNDECRPWKGFTPGEAGYDLELHNENPTREELDHLLALERAALERQLAVEKAGRATRRRERKRG